MTDTNDWKPQQHGGFTRGNWGVDFDGEDVEASVNVSGYGGYSDRVCLPLPVLRALLSAHGLHIVSEAERKVLEGANKAHADAQRYFRALESTRAELAKAEALEAALDRADEQRPIYD